MRFLYRCLLRAHPNGFREKFAGAMLWIFDQQRGLRSRTALLADGLQSLLRQRVWRPAIAEQARPLAEGFAFQLLEDSPLSGSALLQGTVLSIAAFAALVFIAGRGGGHPLWRFGSHRQEVAGSLTPGGTQTALTEVRVSPEAADVPYFEQVPVLAALDTDHDGILSAAEIANAPSALRKLDSDHDGALSAAECGAPPGYGSEFMLFHPVLAALDANHDGTISAAEIADAPAALKALDRDADGDLTEDELRPGTDAGLSVLLSEFGKAIHGAKGSIQKQRR
jgi:hypothetical protein